MKKLRHPTLYSTTRQRTISVSGTLLALLLFPACKTPPPPEPPTPPESIEATRQIYLLIDDAGQSVRQANAFLTLPAPLTLAILPNCPCTKKVAQALSKNHPDKQFILHQPMEPLNPAINPGPGAIRSDTLPEQVATLLTENMAQLPGACGMNNHMGSRITQDRPLMTATILFCKTNHLFFIDSFTTPESIAGVIACEQGVPTARQSVFLDNDHSEQAIQKQFERGMQIAETHGTVIMIGHAWSPATARVISRMIPIARASGYSFHPLSDLFAPLQPSERQSAATIAQQHK